MGPDKTLASSSGLFSSLGMRNRNTTTLATLATLACFRITLSTHPLMLASCLLPCTIRKCTGIRTLVFTDIIIRLWHRPFRVLRR
jgi:hypothetical protein